MNGARLARARMGNYTFATTLAEILRKYLKYPPLLTFHIYETHYRFNNTQDLSIIPKNSPMAKSFLQHIIKEEIPAEMAELLKDFAIKFYEGCLVVQVFDHRPAQPANKDPAAAAAPATKATPTAASDDDPPPQKPKSYRTLLRPTAQSLYYDLLYHTDLTLTKFTDLLSLQMEAEILTLTNRKLDLLVPLNPYLHEHLRPDHEFPKLVHNDALGDTTVVHAHRPAQDVPVRKLHLDQMTLEKSSEYDELMFLLSDKYKPQESTADKKLVVVGPALASADNVSLELTPAAASHMPEKAKRVTPAANVLSSATSNQFMRLRFIEEIRKRKESQKAQAGAVVAAQTGIPGSSDFALGLRQGPAKPMAAAPQMASKPVHPGQAQTPVQNNLAQSANLPYQQPLGFSPSMSRPQMAQRTLASMQGYSSPVVANSPMQQVQNQVPLQQLAQQAQQAMRQAMNPASATPMTKNRLRAQQIQLQQQQQQQQQQQAQLQAQQQAARMRSQQQQQGAVPAAQQQKRQKLDGNYNMRPMLGSNLGTPVMEQARVPVTSPQISQQMQNMQYQRPATQMQQLPQLQQLQPQLQQQPQQQQQTQQGQTQQESKPTTQQQQQQQQIFQMTLSSQEQHTFRQLQARMNALVQMGNTGVAPNRLRLTPPQQQQAIQQAKQIQQQLLQRFPTYFQRLRQFQVLQQLRRQAMQRQNQMSSPQMNMQMNNQMSTQMNNQMSSPMSSQINNQMSGQMANQMSNQINNQMSPQMTNQMSPQMNNQMNMQGMQNMNNNINTAGTSNVNASLNSMGQMPMNNINNMSDAVFNQTMMGMTLPVMPQLMIGSPMAGHMNLQPGQK